MKQYIIWDDWNREVVSSAHKDMLLSAGIITKCGGSTFSPCEGYKILEIKRLLDKHPLVYYHLSAQSGESLGVLQVVGSNLQKKPFQTAVSRHLNQDVDIRVSHPNDCVSQLVVKAITAEGVHYKFTAKQTNLLF